MERGMERSRARPCNEKAALPALPGGMPLAASPGSAAAATHGAQPAVQTQTQTQAEPWPTSQATKQ